MSPRILPYCGRNSCCLVGPDAVVTKGVVIRARFPSSEADAMPLKMIAPSSIGPFSMKLRDHRMALGPHACWALEKTSEFSSEIRAGSFGTSYAHVLCKCKAATRYLIHGDLRRYCPLPVYEKYHGHWHDSK